ncbi:hypothetical protein [Nonomuraea lactucae]|nr:hypothetical protein [Nonomuraea lactucae]
MVDDLGRNVLYARMRAHLTGTPVLVERVRENGRPGVHDPESDRLLRGGR